MRVSGVDRLFDDGVVKAALLHPADRQEIVQAGEEAIAESVFGMPMGSRKMLNGHFGHGKPVHLGERGEKPVHVVEKGDAFDDRAPEDFQGTAGVVNAVAENGVANQVRQP